MKEVKHLKKFLLHVQKNVQDRFNLQFLYFPEQNIFFMHKWTRIQMQIHYTLHNEMKLRTKYFTVVYSGMFPFPSHTTNMATFFILRHPVTILVTVLTTPYNLASDHLILLCKGSSILMLFREDFSFFDSIQLNHHSHS